MTEETKTEETTVERLKRLAAQNAPAADEPIKEAKISEVVPTSAPTPIAVEANQAKIKEIQSELRNAQVEVIPDAPEKTFHVFYHTLPNANMTIPTGGRVSFVNHRYITDQAHEIEHLQSEIARGNRRLSVKAGKEIMTATELDPMASLRKAHFEEFKAMQAEAARKIAAGEPLSQSESEVQALTPGSTSDIASLAAGSGN